MTWQSWSSHWDTPSPNRFRRTVAGEAHKNRWKYDGTSPPQCVSLWADFIGLFWPYPLTSGVVARLACGDASCWERACFREFVTAFVFRLFALNRIVRICGYCCCVLPFLFISPSYCGHLQRTEALSAAAALAAGEGLSTMVVMAPSVIRGLASCLLQHVGRAIVSARAHAGACARAWPGMAAHACAHACAHARARAQACARLLVDAVACVQRLMSRCVGVLAATSVPGHARGESERQGRRTGGEQDSGLCVVCLDRVASHSFVPCGHRCVCEACGHQLMEASSLCPTCREKAVMVMRVFSAGFDDRD